MEDDNRLENRAQYSVIFSIVAIWMGIIIIAGTLGTVVVLVTGLPGLISQVVFQTIGIFIIMWLMRDNENFSFNSTIEDRQNQLRWSVGLWVIYIGIFYGIGQLLQLLVSLFEDDTISTYENLAQGIPEAVLLFLSLAILAPVFEELVFRKFVIHAFLNAGYSKAVAFFHSVIIFATIHMISDIRLGSAGFAIQHFVLLLGSGSVFGLVYFYTRDIRYPIIIHMISNIYGAGGLIIGLIFPSAVPIMSVIFQLFTLLAIIFAIYKIYTNYSDWKDDIQEFLEEVKSHFASNKQAWIIFLTSLVGLFGIPVLFLLVGQAIDNPSLQSLTSLSVSFGYGTSFLLAVILHRVTVVDDGASTEIEQHGQS